MIFDIYVYIVCSFVQMMFGMRCCCAWYVLSPLPLVVCLSVPTILEIRYERNRGIHWCARHKLSSFEQAKQMRQLRKRRWVSVVMFVRPARPCVVWPLSSLIPPPSHSAPPPLSHSPSPSYPLSLSISLSFCVHIYTHTLSLSLSLSLSLAVIASMHTHTPSVHARARFLSLSL